MMTELSSMGQIDSSLKQIMRVLKTCTSSAFLRIERHPVSNDLEQFPGYRVFLRQRKG
ncbi:hypothetical protein HFO18_17580 [Rhizobium laguerreae]|uniref:hypothetical protein n=1 Tax=Rhizobium sp. 25PS6 TaxID=3075622 RepID=UPI0029059909|nr:hypothetical protein [Rhizobium sp. 25PS6]MBY3222904.1 hypothetical protein [Rhizobium laguerreae]